MIIFVDTLIIISNQEVVHIPFKAYPMIALIYFCMAIKFQDWHLMFVLTIVKTFNTLGLAMAITVSVFISFLLLIYCQIVIAMSHVMVIQHKNVVVFINGMSTLLRNQNHSLVNVCRIREIRTACSYRSARKVRVRWSLGRIIMTVSELYLSILKHLKTL